MIWQLSSDSTSVLPCDLSVISFPVKGYGGSVGISVLSVISLYSWVISCGGISGRVKLP